MYVDVLLFTTNLQKAKEELALIGGSVTHQFTDSVIVVRLPETATLESLIHAKPNFPDALDPVSQLAVDSWKFMQSKKMVNNAPSATEGLSWDTPGYSSPRHGHNDPEFLKLLIADPQPTEENAYNRVAPLLSFLSPDSEVEQSTGTSTSLYMIGSVAVGIVIVSGNTPQLTFSQAEQQQVLAEVQEALNFLATQEPRAKLTFVYDIRIVNVNAAPGSTADYETAEAPWRNAALGAMGYPANRSGSQKYVRELRAARSTNWAYVAYFTKYQLHHFAYAVQEKICMEYANDGWGSNQINRVFAHETCHIFGAADEYGNCQCGGSYGYLGVPNNNCVNCGANRVSCLMDANVLELCQWSRGQIGWDDRIMPVLLQADIGLPPGDPGWKVVGVGDFNGDGTHDILWRRQDDSGEARIWLIKDGHHIADIGLPPGDPGWKVVGIGDFNGDGTDDILWRRQDDSGEARIWLIKDGHHLADIGLPAGLPGWKVVGVGDFNGDGTDDILWRRQDDTGEARIWLIKDGYHVADIGLPAGHPGWKVVGVGDFNGDGTDDILWRRQDDTGEARIWLIKDGHHVADIGLPAGHPGWKVVGVGDFNGDGTDDILWRRQNDSAEARIWLVKNGNLTRDVGLPPPESGWRVVAVGTFNSRNNAHVVWRRVDNSGEARIWIPDL